VDPGGRASGYDFLGESPATTARRDSVRRLLGRLAGQRVMPPVRLVGETGAGKDLLADVLHRAGPRNGKPFVNMCVSAIPEMFLEPALLGWKGPALEHGGWGHPGFIRAAHQGTITSRACWRRCSAAERYGA
jgi:DNA-binding NtrC family response regulator